MCLGGGTETNNKEQRPQVASILFLVKGSLQLFLQRAADEDG